MSLSFTVTDVSDPVEKTELAMVVELYRSLSPEQQKEILQHLLEASMENPASEPRGIFSHLER
ncbi:MAG: hypothetical protein PW734_01070 [Verrucomicrobium sp.]|nr:hypothetical protein [Verrucomicrobium sp.]